MGDNVLMKTKLLILILPLFALAQNPQPDMQWVDEEIAAIKPPRTGLATNALLGLTDPFAAQLILNQPPQPKKEPGTYVKRKPMKPFTLESVINSKTALIDGKWYQQNDTIHGYVIQKIEGDSVLLKNKKKQLRLSLKTENAKIKINVK